MEEEPINIEIHQQEEDNATPCFKETEDIESCSKLVKELVFIRATSKPSLPRKRRFERQSYVHIDSSSSDIQSSEDEYQPRKSDLETSESNSDIQSSDGVISSDDIKKKRKQKQKSKRKQRRLFKPSEQSGDSINGSRKNPEKQKGTPLESAKQSSLLEYRKRLETNRHHTKILDSLLKSNSLRRQHVPAVGNCFFEAAAKQTTEKVTASILREQVCDHIKEKSDYYMEFLSSANVNIETEIETLRQPNNWTTALSDAMPLALANLLSVTVKIYSSNKDQPVIVIHPSLCEPIEKEELTLAYLCIPGVEHYDAVKRRTVGISSESELDVCDISDNNINTVDISVESIVDNTVSEPSSETPSKSTRNNTSKNITPRKQAKYQSPKRKNLTRKKKANPENWKRNIR